MFKELMSRLFSAVMSDDIKKLFLVVSLTFEIVNVEDEQTRELLLNHLNDSMDLALRDGALRLPAFVHGLVWGDVNHPRLTLQCNISQLPDDSLIDIVSNAPPCIRYADPAAMARDVRNAICNVLSFGTRTAA